MASARSKNPDAPSARGQGYRRAGQRADRDQAAGRDRRQFLAGHLAHEEPLARGSDEGDDQDAAEAGQDPGHDGPVALRIRAQALPGGRARPVDGGHRQIGHQGQQDRRAAVEAQRQTADPARATMTSGPDRVDQAGSADAGQDRSSDRAP
jgi:hypothetical protein